MGTPLTAQTPGLPDYTYKGVLNIEGDNLGLTAALRNVCDGLGNNTGIELSNTTFKYTGIVTLIGNTGITGKLTTTSTAGTQAAFRYDASNLVNFTTDATGLTIFDSVGTNASFELRVNAKTGLLLNPDDGLYVLGDIYNSGNDNYISINDTSETALFRIAGYAAATNGDVLSLVDNTTGEVEWVTPSGGGGSAALTQYYVGVGDASNILSGSANLKFGRTAGVGLEITTDFENLSLIKATGSNGNLYQTFYDNAASLRAYLGFAGANWTNFYLSGTDNLVLTFTNGVGIGTGTTINAKLHVLSTTVQQRNAYDGSNYMTVTTGATGTTTFALTGTTPKFVFANLVNMTLPVSAAGLAAGDLWNNAGVVNIV